MPQWLENDFINESFSDNEKSIIVDKQAFSLSIEDANTYFSSDIERQCKPTNYAIANGAHVNSSNGNCWWWLSTRWYNQNYNSLVKSGGDISVNGDNVNYLGNAVRPALWINLKSIDKLN